MTDEYRKLKEYPAYRIYNDGRIYSEKINRFIKAFNDNHGYMQVFLYPGKSKKERVCVKLHKLIAKAFVENHQGYVEVNHKDDNKANNHYTNLEWCDRSYNINYTNQGRIKFGQEHVSPMTKDMVLLIPTLMNYKFSLQLIASLYKVGHITIRKVVKGSTWKNLNLTFPPKTYRNKGLYQKGILEVPQWLYDKLISFNVDNTVLNSRVKVLESV